MNLVNRDTDYAIRALCFIAKNRDRIVSVSELVDKLKIPRPFLRKILQRLNNEDILHSYKGRGGGFMLARLPQKILLIELINIFQGEISIKKCLFKRLACPNQSSCYLKKKLDVIERYVIKELKSITLASLLR
ncbi:MAG: Rrf2 family transcriptional regulator [Candidatus Omnitrophica bacterium]|nr:Rrf2 family transcriptional regulator [Candidatus Omnitrophota bacterium]